jgi:hypothetical protein
LNIVRVSKRNSTSKLEGRSTSPTTHPREIVPHDRLSIDIGKREINFNIDGVRSAFKLLRFEVCIMINVNYVLPYRHIGREDPKENEAKEENMLHPSIP